MRVEVLRGGAAICPLQKSRGLGRLFCDVVALGLVNHDCGSGPNGGRFASIDDPLSEGHRIYASIHDASDFTVSSSM